MVKVSGYICQECSYLSPKWLGRCPECNSWNSFEQSAKKKKSVHSSNTNAKKLSQISLNDHHRHKTSINELDIVLGGGVVPGSLTLIGGEPGVGKSTLLMMMSDCLTHKTLDKVLYISGEESEHQLGQRAARLNIINESLYLYSERVWQNILSTIKKIKPKFVILDSIQTTMSHDIASPPGSISQVREITHELMSHIKANNISSFIVGHITKEGSLAGPKVLEHMVDTVIYFEGERDTPYRILRAIKNRFGNTSEVGFFEMRKEGLVEVNDISSKFLKDHSFNDMGRALTCSIEGGRSIFLEIQALVVDNKGGFGRRVTQGLDGARLSLLIAVIEKYLSIDLSHSDIFLNIVSGFKITSRESDLAVIAGLITSHQRKLIKSTHAFVGEVGLSGELRRVPMAEQRFRDLELHGFEVVYTDEQTQKMYANKFNKLTIVGLREVKELLSYI